MTDQFPETPSRNDISIRELILQAQSYVWELLRNWKLILLFVLPFVVFYLYKALSAPDKYTAQLTFMVNDESSKTTGYSNFLTNLGLGVGASSEYNLDKILELSKSNLIIQRVLFKWDTIRGQEDYLANHMIREFDLHEKWKGGWLEGLVFEHDSVAIFSRKEKAVLKSLYLQVVGTPNQPGCLRSSYSETSGIMKLETTTPGEGFSLALADVMFNELSQYYIETAIEKSKDTYDRLKEKVDSVRGVLESKQYQLASFVDANRGLANQKAALQRERLQGEVQMLTVMYTETVRNMEVSSFALKNDTPFIRAIDRPYAPLWNLKPKWYFILPKGIAIGVVLGVFFVLGRRIYFEIMTEKST
ncbi:MAG: hypothetical protein KDC34_03825 [Saprospiraceae bacterium]|nr:hypothetical protein [Saprospiraceae bacterium]